MDDDHFLNKLGKVISHKSLKSYLVISGLGFLFKGLFNSMVSGGFRRGEVSRRSSSDL